MSGPRHKYDFDLPGVECMLKMPFFLYPVHCTVPRNLGEFVLCPREGTSWALCRFRRVELILCSYLLIIFVSATLSEVVLYHQILPLAIQGNNLEMYIHQFPKCCGEYVKKLLTSDVIFFAKSYILSRPQRALSMYDFVCCSQLGLQCAILISFLNSNHIKDCL